MPRSRRADRRPLKPGRPPVEPGPRHAPGGRSVPTTHDPVSTRWPGATTHTRGEHPRCPPLRWTPRTFLSYAKAKARWHNMARRCGSTPAVRVPRRQRPRPRGPARTSRTDSATAEFLTLLRRALGTGLRPRSKRRVGLQHEHSNEACRMASAVRGGDSETGATTKHTCDGSIRRTSPTHSTPYALISRHSSSRRASCPTCHSCTSPQEGAGTDRGRAARLRTERKTGPGYLPCVRPV